LSPANKRYTDPDVPVFACEIDFELRLDGSSDITNAELKTVHPFMAKEWGESGTDTAPIHYLAQGMWGLGITKRKHCIVGALFGADSLRVYPVDRDDETIAAMRFKAAKFWSDHVLTRIPPPPAVLADMDVLFPKESEAARCWPTTSSQQKSFGCAPSTEKSRPASPSSICWSSRLSV
jgi:hypothetical protein